MRPTGFDKGRFIFPDTEPVAEAAGLAK